MRRPDKTLWEIWISGKLSNWEIMLKFAVVSKKSSHLGRFLGNLAYFGVNFLLLCYFFGITIFFFKYSLEFCLVCFILKTMFFRLRNKKYLKQNICSRFCHFARSCLFLIRFFIYFHNSFVGFRFDSFFLWFEPNVLFFSIWLSNEECCIIDHGNAWLVCRQRQN